MAKSVVYLAEFKPYDVVAGVTRDVFFSQGLLEESVPGTSGVYPIRLREPYSHETSVFDQNIPGGTTISVGNTVINNADGRFDFLLNYSWDGRDFVVKQGYLGDDYSTYTTVLQGSSTEIIADGGNLVIALRDNSFKLVKLMQENRYLGSGGSEGTKDLQNRFKPLCFGPVRNISPVVLDPVNLLFQIHDGPVEAISAVYDRGVPLTFSANYADFAALSAATVAPGYFATCLAGGYVRLGAPSEGALTLDAVGQYNAPTLPELLRAVLLGKGGLTSAQLNEPSFTVLASEATWSFEGIYSENPDYQLDEFVETVVSSMNCFWHINKAGLLTVRLFKFRSPVASVRLEDLVGLGKVASPRPLHRVRTNYAKNLTIQAANDFTLPKETLNGYLEDSQVYVATAADGTGGVYSYQGRFRVFLNKTEVNDLPEVLFTKVSGGSWLNLSGDGTFTISDPGADTASVTLRASLGEYFVEDNFTLKKSKTTPAKNLVMAADSRRFYYDQSGLASPSVQDITVTATPTNVTTPLTWSAVDNLGQTVQLSGSGNSRIISIGSLVNSPLVTFVVVTATSPDGSSSKIRLVVQHGDSGIASGILSAVTASGNPVTGYLTNENHTLPATNAGVVTSYAGAFGEFKVFDHVTDVTALATFSVLAPSAGLTVSMGSNGAYSFTLADANDSGTATLHAEYGGVGIDRQLSVSKSKGGADGSGAKLLTVLSDRQSITYASGGVIHPTLQPIVFSTNKQNTSATVNWTLTDGGGTNKTPVTTYLSAATGDSVTMTAAQFEAARGTTEAVIVTATLTDGTTTLVDKISIVKVQSGIDGVDAIVGYLTNEAEVVSATAGGAVASYASSGGTFKVNDGTTEATSGVAYSVVAGSVSSGLSISIDSVTGVYTVTDLTADKGTATLRATYKGVTIDKIYTISKAKAGTNPITGYLTNENATVAASSSGTVASFSDAGGTFKVMEGLLDVTALATFSIPTPTTGLTMTINSSGVYTVTDLTVNQASVTLRAVYSGVTVDKTYIITKSRSGADGSTAKVLTITSDRQTITYDGSGALSPATQTTTFTAYKQNTAEPVNWNVYDGDGIARTPSSTYLSAATGDSVTMTAAQFEAARGATSGVMIMGFAVDGLVLTDRVSVVKVQAGAAGSNAKIITLTASSQTFKYDKAGAPLAQTITFAAVKQNTSAATFWRVRDGAGTSLISGDAAAIAGTTYFTRVNDDTLTMSHTQYQAFASGGPRTFFTVEASFTDGTTVIDKVSVTKVQDGADGATGTAGLNNATVFVYRRSATTPSLPANSTNYTFATGVLTGLTNGWTQTVPTSDGNPLWVTAATASSNGASDNIAASEWAAPVIQAQDGAKGDSTIVYDPIDYATIADFQKKWDTNGTGTNSIVTTADTGGSAMKSTGRMNIYRRIDKLPYSPEDLYEVAFDIETTVAGGTSFLYLGVEGFDANGNHIGQNFNYVAFLGGNAATILGRRTFRGYMRGLGPQTTGDYRPDPSNPSLLPNGTVSICPIALLNYQGAATDEMILHSVTLRKMDDANVIWTGDWSSSKTYNRSDGVLYLGRSFSSKIFGNLNNTPPSTGTSNASWQLVSDKGDTGSTGAPGLNSATVTLYRRSASTPSLPANTITYTFATGVASGITNAWTQTVPTADGNPLWTTMATALGSGTTDNIAASEWAAPSIVAQDGEIGSWTPVLTGPGMKRQGSTFTKVGGTDNAWSQSVRSLERVRQAVVSFQPQTLNYLMVGLTVDGSASNSFSDITHAMELLPDGTIDYFSSGTAIASGVGTYSLGDSLSVAHIDTSIVFIKNGSVFYTSPISVPTSTLLGLDTSFYKVGSYITALTLTSGASSGSSSFTLVPQGPVTITPNSVTKYSGHGTFNGGAYSAQSFSGGAFVSARGNTATSGGWQSYFGLNTDASADTNWGSIDYGIQFLNTSATSITSGIGRTSTSYVRGVDVLSIRYEAETVRWLKNGVEFDSVAAPANLRLFLDVALVHDGPQGAITDLTFGPIGASGFWKDVKFIRQNATPARPTGVSPAGWSDGVPLEPVNATVWQSTAFKTYAGSLLGQWSSPAVMTSVVYRGAHTIGENYYVNNSVTFNGGSYICTTENVASSTNKPTGTDQANAWWDVLAAPGEAGTPATPPTAFTATINLSTGGGVNLRTLADSAGYTGQSNATVTYNIPAGVTITGTGGSGGGGVGISTGTWPAGYTISLTLTGANATTSIVRGGGGGGGDGGGWGNTQGGVGGKGGDAISCSVPMTINGAFLCQAGGGGGGGANALTTGFPEPSTTGGDGGGGGAPNGAGGFGGGGDFGEGANGNPGTTSGGGTGAGNGGTYGVAGSAASGGAGGGAAGYAIRKNGNTVTVTKTGTTTGTVG